MCRFLSGFLAISCLIFRKTRVRQCGSPRGIWLRLPDRLCIQDSDGLGSLQPVIAGSNTDRSFCVFPLLDAVVLDAESNEEPPAWSGKNIAITRWGGLLRNVS